MNMQNADAFVSPHTTASTRATPLIALGGETSNSGNKAGDRAASLWIQRLKPREESDSLKGETLVSDNGTPQGLHAGNSDADSSMRPFRNHLQEASFTKTWGNKPGSKIRKVDEKNAAIIDAVDKKISSGEVQDYGVEMQQNLIKQEQGKIVPLATPHTCDEQTNVLTNQSSDAKFEKKLPTKLMTDMTMSSRCISEAAITLHTCIQAAESKNQILHAIRVQAAEGGILPSSLGKPPLPPSQNKAGLPPRSASHKSSSFLARPSGRNSTSPINSKLAAVPLQDTARHPSHIAVMKESFPATIDSAGPPLKEGHQFKEDGMGCQDPLSKENGMCIKTRRVLPCTQTAKSVSFSQKVVPSAEFGMHQLTVHHSEGIYSYLTSKPPKKIPRQDFEAMDVIVLGAERLKKPSGLETSERASSFLLKERSVPMTPSECTVVSSQADQTMEATPNASTTARFPWEMFAGAAGPSRSARDEFVEVYNRARNELKNQRSSSSITKVCYKEMGNRPKSASGHATYLQDTLMVEQEGQTSDEQPQGEIPEQRSKFEGLDCVAQHERVKVTETSVQIPQKQPFSEKHNRASFLEGDAGISLGKKSQALQSGHGKESNSFMLGQSGGPRSLHGCVKSPAAVGQNDCSLTFGKSLQCRQGFARNAMLEVAPSTCHDPFQTAHVDQMDHLPHDNKKTLMLLSKRQLGMFDSSPGVVTGKESFQRITLSRKSDAWLQRWYPPYITRIKGSQEHKHCQSDRIGQDSAGNMLLAKESNEDEAYAKEALKKRLIERGVLYEKIGAGEQPECSKASFEKILPSAAAMAIVATAARQFCTVEPQQKGSFAFWSGFGMQTPPTREHFTEQGKRKLTFKEDPSAQP